MDKDYAEIQRRPMSVQPPDSTHARSMLVSAHVVPEDQDIETRLRAEFKEKLQSIAAFQSTQQEIIGPLVIPAAIVPAESIESLPPPVLPVSPSAALSAHGSIQRKRKVCVIVSVLTLMVGGTTAGVVFGLGRKAANHRLVDAVLLETTTRNTTNASTFETSSPTLNQTTVPITNPSDSLDPLTTTTSPSYDSSATPAPTYGGTPCHIKANQFSN